MICKEGDTISRWVGVKTDSRIQLTSAKLHTGKISGQQSRSSSASLSRLILVELTDIRIPSIEFQRRPATANQRKKRESAFGFKKERKEGKRGQGARMS